MLPSNPIGVRKRLERLSQELQRGIRIGMVRMVRDLQCGHPRTPKAGGGIVAVRRARRPIWGEDGTGGDARKRRQVPLARHLQVHARDPIGQRDWNKFFALRSDRPTHAVRLDHDPSRRQRNDLGRAAIGWPYYFHRHAPVKEFPDRRQRIPQLTSRGRQVTAIDNQVWA